MRKRTDLSTVVGVSMVEMLADFNLRHGTRLKIGQYIAYACKEHSKAWRREKENQPKPSRRTEDKHQVVKTLNFDRRDSDD